MALAFWNDNHMMKKKTNIILNIIFMLLSLAMVVYESTHDSSYKVISIISLIIMSVLFASFTINIIKEQKSKKKENNEK